MEWMILPLKRYFDFKGRSRRKEFWMFWLFTMVVGVVLTILDNVLGLGGSSTTTSEYGEGSAYVGSTASGGLLTGLFQLAMLIPTIAVSVRRLHDTNRRGWWYLLPWPFVALLFLGAVTGAVSAFSGQEPSNGGLLAGGVLSIIGGLGAIGAAITLFVFFCLDGTDGPNRFGEDPKNPIGDVEDVFG